MKGDVKQFCVWVDPKMKNLGILVLTMGVLENFDKKMKFRMNILLESNVNPHT